MFTRRCYCRGSSFSSASTTIAMPQVTSHKTVLNHSGRSTEVKESAKDWASDHLIVIAQEDYAAVLPAATYPSWLQGN